METTSTSGLVFGDLASCNTEPLRFLGSVQSRGALLAFTPNDRRIQSVSKNFEDVLGLSHREALGARIDQLFDAGFSAEVENAVRAHPWRDLRGVDLYCEMNGRGYNAYLFSSEGLFCLEFEQPALDVDALKERRGIDRLINEYLASSKNAESTAALALAACRGVREVTGMDRVMMYRFEKPSWDGLVVAEDRVIQAHSYNGHRFPASDIPQQARDLYLQNSVRVISDVEEGIAPLDPVNNPITRKPIDLSDSRLRAVSPIHVEYLRNMGVRSSLSIAVIYKGELWGLIACHNATRPLRLSLSARQACELIANTFAGQHQLLETVQHQEKVSTFELRAKKLIREISGSPTPIDELLRRHQLAQDLFHADGIAHIQLAEQKVDFAGLTPPRALLLELAEQLSARQSTSAIALTSLVELGEKWAEFAGIASGALAFSLDPNELMIVFRRETIQRSTWGGDPRKQLAKKNFTGRINPRVSFDTWEMVIRNHSEPWLPHEISGAEFLRDCIRNALRREA